MNKLQLLLIWALLVRPELDANTTILWLNANKKHMPSPFLSSCFECTISPFSSGSIVYTCVCFLRVSAFWQRQGFCMKFHHIIFAHTHTHTHTNSTQDTQCSEWRQCHPVQSYRFANSPIKSY